MKMLLAILTITLIFNVQQPKKDNIAKAYNLCTENTNDTVGLYKGDKILKRCRHRRRYCFRRSRKLRKYNISKQ